MNWISTKNMKNEDAPEGQVLVQYLEPSFGYWSVDFATGYFDNPDDYTDDSGQGWKHWFTENKINVIAYCLLPKSEKLKNSFEHQTQVQTKEKYGSYRPNLGNVGE